MGIAMRILQEYYRNCNENAAGILLDCHGNTIRNCHENTIGILWEYDGNCHENVLGIAMRILREFP